MARYQWYVRWVVTRTANYRNSYKIISVFNGTAVFGGGTGTVYFYGGRANWYQFTTNYSSCRYCHDQFVWCCAFHRKNFLNMPRQTFALGSTWNLGNQRIRKEGWIVCNLAICIMYPQTCCGGCSSNIHGSLTLFVLMEHRLPCLYHIGPSLQVSPMTWALSIDIMHSDNKGSFYH